MQKITKERSIENMNFVDGIFKVAAVFILFMFILIFANTCLANTEYSLNDVQYNYENAMYDKVAVGENSYYLPHKDFIFVLRYTTSIAKFDTISSNPVEYQKRFYKFDVYEEDNIIYIVLLNFIDEDNGIEDTIIIKNKKEISDWLENYE